MTLVNPYLFWMKSVNQRQKFVVDSFGTGVVVVKRSHVGITGRSIK